MAIRSTAGASTSPNRGPSRWIRRPSAAGGRERRIHGPDAVGCSYDLENRLTGISGAAAASFLYDTFGNRRQATRNGTVTRYVIDVRGMGNVLFETDDAGNPINYYIHGLGLIARISAAGDTRCYHFDNMGSIVAMTGPAQDITHAYCYDPFGRLLDDFEEDHNPYRFVGLHGVSYEEPGFYYMRARYYDPDAGRFLGEDPVWAPNLYPYAGSNPVMRNDPRGALWGIDMTTVLKGFNEIMDLKKYFDIGKAFKELDDSQRDLDAQQIEALEERNRGELDAVEDALNIQRQHDIYQQRNWSEYQRPLLEVN